MIDHRKNDLIEKNLYDDLDDEKLARIIFFKPFSIDSRTQRERSNFDKDFRTGEQSRRKIIATGHRTTCGSFTIGKEITQTISHANRFLATRVTRGVTFDVCSNLCNSTRNFMIAFAHGIRAQGETTRPASSRVYFPPSNRAALIVRYRFPSFLSISFPPKRMISIGSNEILFIYIIEKKMNNFEKKISICY